VRNPLHRAARRAGAALGAGAAVFAAAWLAARLAELPAGDQALLAARFGDGPSVAAVGAAFGFTADGAHGRLRRILNRLRRRAEEWWHGDGE